MVSYSQCREVAMARDHMDPLPHRPWWWRLLGINSVRGVEMLGHCRGVAGVDHMRGVTVTAPIPINLIYIAVVWVWSRLKQPLWLARRRTAREDALLSACYRMRRQVHAHREGERLLAQELCRLDVSAVDYIVFQSVSGGPSTITVRRRDGSEQHLEFDTLNMSGVHGWHVAPERSALIENARAAALATVGQGASA